MKTVLMKCLRAGYRKMMLKDFSSPWEYPDVKDRIEANNVILEKLKDDKPLFVGRVGTTEGNLVNNYITVHDDKSILVKLWNYINDNTRLPWWDTGLPFKQIQECSGFFAPNVNISQIEKFCEIYLEGIRNMDICGRFMYNEKFFPFNENCIMFQLETLYPFFVSTPWTAALKGKKVVVVHPFRDSILTQYEKRKYLFKNHDVLPDFDLQVIKAVQTLCGEPSQFRDWFEALDSMKEALDKTKFDVAILGCGAYGLPLASFVKNMGKKAIHMGGGTQLMFGIKGKRWELYEDSSYRDQFNDYWIYPKESERPKNAQKVEGACYW